MASNNLIIHTGNSFELTDIHYVYFTYIKNPTWTNVSGMNMDPANARILEYNESASTEEISTWEYDVVKNNNNSDITFKFNVIALFKELNPELIDPETGKLIEEAEGESEKQLLAYGNYKSYQMIDLSEKWVINISSSWRFTNAEETDPSTEFRILYNEHTVKTDPISTEENGLSSVHDRLLDSYAVPASKAVNNMVSQYQSRGVPNISTGELEISNIYGLNIVSYKAGTNEVDQAVNKSKGAAQWLVLDKLGPGYEDVIALYDASEYDNKFSSYEIKRITKYTYDKIGG